MRLIRAKMIADDRTALFVDRRVGGVNHVTLAPQRCPLRWAIFVLQTVHVSHDHLLPLVVFLHKHDPVEVVLTLSGEYLCVIDANCLFAVF
jgi:hypothetical protein